MPLMADRVKQTTTSTGTGAVALTGSVLGFRDFSAAFSSGAAVYYCIADATNWEVGTGTFTGGATPSLSRDAVLSSSNGNALVSFPAGTKEVFVTAPAAKINMAGGWTVADKAADFSVAGTDAGTAYRCIATATVSVAATSSLPAGWTIRVWAAAGPVTIDPAGTETINGKATLAIAVGEWADVVSTGTALLAFGVAPPSSTTTWLWDAGYKAAAISLSDAARTAAKTGASSSAGVLGNTAITGGKFVFTVQCQSGDWNGNAGIGICTNRSADLTAYVNDSAAFLTYKPDGYLRNGSTSTSGLSSYGGGDYVTVGVNTTIGGAWFARNGVWQAGGNPAAGTNPGLTFTPGATVYPLFTSYSAATVTIPVVPPFSEPSGFTRL